MQLEGLGKDVLFLIFMQLPARAVLNLGATCKLLHGESKKPLLWRKLILRDYGVETKDDPGVHLHYIYENPLFEYKLFYYLRICAAAA